MKTASYPRLYSMSTVCLLKHYNQDYLLHPLRTDFTGSNGVGKSIIADLFQIVFVAENRHVKFATEGIDKKERRIEKLPYNSGIGYVFFNVEVSNGKFITLGAAILQQGVHTIKPFLVTAAVDLSRDKLEQHQFSEKKLLLHESFLKPNREPYTPDELSRLFSEKNGLFFHYFSSKDEKTAYHQWLYDNELLPINLTKESNLRSYARVIQSFSKSKSLDIGSSKDLIDYLFEEDQLEITSDYKQQEETIEKLLFRFKAMKEQITDIGGKQTDLRRLKQYEEEKNIAVYNLDVASYLKASKHRNSKQTETERHTADLQIKEATLEVLLGNAKYLQEQVSEAHALVKQEQKKLDDLTTMRSDFEEIEDLATQAEQIRELDIDGLTDMVPPGGYPELLQKDARYYKEKIDASRAVLRRYGTMIVLEKKKETQDTWLAEKLKDMDNRIDQLGLFARTLEQLKQDTLFTKIWATNKNLSRPHQAILLHLRSVLVGKPKTATEGTRYTDNDRLLQNLVFNEDKQNKGWWIKTGDLHEFVPATSMLLPDLPTIDSSDIEQLKFHVNHLLHLARTEKQLYEQLRNGNMPAALQHCDFDIDLSDTTKVNGHKEAAQLIALIINKIAGLQQQTAKLQKKLNEGLERYGISNPEGLAYDALYRETTQNTNEARQRLARVQEQQSGEKAEITGLESQLPLLRSTQKTLETELMQAEEQFGKQQTDFKLYHPDKEEPNPQDAINSRADIEGLQRIATAASGKYANEYSQAVGKYNETKERRDINVNAQLDSRNYNFSVLERSLLGKMIKTLDDVTGHLETLNAELLTIADDLRESLIKVFGKTESFFDRYRDLVRKLNEFFRGKLISNRFYFRVDFEHSPKFDIKWIEHLRKATSSIAGDAAAEVSPETFILDFYRKYSANKSSITVEDLLNPKRYFVLRGKLTDENDRAIPGSTGEAYTALALLGIARLSVVQDGERPGLRFLILEESATLDDVNFGLFPEIAKNYGYQIITMTPKPYAIGDDNGWYIHQLVPSKGNRDINYPKTMSYFRTERTQLRLAEHLKSVAQ